MRSKRKRKPPAGSVMWVFLFYAYFGIAGVVGMLGSGSLSIAHMTAVYLLVAFGIWRRHTWARWLGLVLSACFVAGVVSHLVRGGSVAGLTFATAFVHAWIVCVLIWRWPKG